MGLLAEIYKWSLGGCSNGGISSRCSKVTIVNASGPFEPDEDAPAVILVARDVIGRKLLTFYPAFARPGEAWVKDTSKNWMMGGTYIATSDSRMSELCDKLGVPFYGAVAFHDRCEG